MGSRTSLTEVYRLAMVYDGRVPPARLNPPLKMGEEVGVAPTDKAGALAHFYVDRCQPGPAPENYQQLIDELREVQKGKQLSQKQGKLPVVPSRCRS